ncbi:MAG: carboxypeptidase M32 [Nitrososphaerota archaeon]|nr:carboxypeptidase M32 [Nitrososphaerota archaeon]
MSEERCRSNLARNPVVGEILKRYTQVWALGHSSAVLSWDTETHMPQSGAKPRGIALGQLAVMSQRATIDLDGLVKKAEKARDLDEMERGVVRVLRRSLDYYLKVPPALVEELQRVTTEATVVWRTARKKSDFKLFRPHLEKIVGLERKVADKLGYEKHPYNALLDMYEEGFTVRDADAVYAELIPQTKKLIAKVAAAGVFPPKHPLESVKYDTASMEAVNQGLVEMLKMPEERFRMDVSTHPFTIQIATDDVRITTRYEGVNFKATMYSTIHESGHAIYGLGTGERLAYTPVGDGASYGIHESQSRFWENIVGRSREFVNLVDPLLRKNLPFVKGYDEESLYRYFNTVRKSFIRVDADELTYNFHTALRYEVEKKVIAGEVKVSEIPALWNDTFDEFFGMRPKNDAEGALQDVHWSNGSFGYFATYTLGNVVSAMIWHKMKDGEVIRGALQKGDVGQLKEWLGTNIHRYGAIYAPKALQEKVFGEAYNPDRLLAYFNQKFLE